jgi:hypothetical protein
MKIGFANFFSFRPHVEHSMFLAGLCERAGHENYFFTCDAAVSQCYSRGLKGTAKWLECPRCIAGGFRSYPVNSISSVGTTNRALPDAQLDQMAFSSSCTLHRTESDNETEELDVIKTREGLFSSINKVYHSALDWIDAHHLDAVICFNGRMDLTRALTTACEAAGIPYITHERTWFGHGLHLIPNANCLSIEQVNRMAYEFRDRPLTTHQAELAARLVAERFLRKNSLEWRVYNRQPVAAPWPLNSPGRRVLVLPSSRNEFAGHPEWASGWRDNTHALDDFFEAFGIHPNQVVVRCHPNWGEMIGRVSGARSMKLYSDWTARRGIRCIASEEKSNTYDLIEQADIVVMNGGSAAVEAGVCGKQIFSLGPVNYEKAGFVRVFRDRESLVRVGAQVELDPELVIRRTLRFVYMSARRFPQYVDQVRAIDTLNYQYFDGLDASPLISMISTGKVEPYDNTYASTLEDEENVVQALKARKWELLAEHSPPLLTLRARPIQRRVGMRWIAGFRSRFAKGDSH